MTRFAVVLTLWSGVAWACKCAPELSVGPCVRNAEVVFAGKVIRTEPESWEAAMSRMLARVEPSLAAKYEAGWSPEELRRAAAVLLSDEERRGLTDSATESKLADKYFRRTATLLVTEAFDGVEAGAEVAIPIGLSSCAIPFDAGESWLIYGSHNSDGQVSTGLCHGTRLLEGAEADLNHLRAVKAGAAKARIFGFVTRDRRDAILYARATKPVAGIAVEISGGKAAGKTLMTNAEGWFDFDGLPPGSTP